MFKTSTSTFIGHGGRRTLLYLLAGLAVSRAYLNAPQGEPSSNLATVSLGALSPMMASMVCSSEGSILLVRRDLSPLASKMEAPNASMAFRRLWMCV